MADDNNARYRSTDSLGRGSAPAGQGSDPLAELARLIGRNDPFADLERSSHLTSPGRRGAEDHADLGHAGPAYTPPSHASEPAPQYGSDPASHFDEPASRYDSDAVPRFGKGDAPHYADQGQPRLDWAAGSSSEGSHGNGPFSLLSEQPQALSASSYQGRSYSDPHDLSAIDDERSHHPALGEPASQPMPDHPAFLQALYPRAAAAGPMPSTHDDEFYDDAPRPERRKGLLTVVAVLALAVIGTAGAFAYRSVFGGASPHSPPPVIRATGEPSKVAPAMQPVDPTASKFSYDRFSDRGQNEKVVVREEKPVDDRELGRTSIPRAALPGTSSVAGPQAAAAQDNSNPRNPPSALGEPRRVRTVPIRPDQPDVAAGPQSPVRPQAAPMQIVPAPPAPPPARQPVTVAEAPVNSRADASPPPVNTRAGASSPPVNTRAAAPHSNPRVAARSAAAPDNAPLSLSPDGNTASASRAAPPARVAAAPAANGGGYLVQVSSQKSEADAQSSYRAIQSKYSNVLSGQRHIIRRADLGSKGVYYRAMVGPFSSRDQASQLCSSLKAAGGSCIVQAN